MDAFNDNFDQTDVDPAAEFLAREQDDLAGLEDELKPAMSIPPVVIGNYRIILFSRAYKTTFLNIFNARYMLNQCFDLMKHVYLITIIKLV